MDGGRVREAEPFELSLKMTIEFGQCENGSRASVEFR
jgi:hypothetical protein